MTNPDMTIQQQDTTFDQGMVNERIKREVIKTIIQPLKKQWQCKNVSEVIERLFLEYKYRGKK